MAEPLALEYAARGWYVFPCKPDKSPYTQHGKNDATQDPDQIRRWWGTWPDALIGIYCERSSIFVLDIDVKNGRDGWQSLTLLLKEHGGEDIPVGPAQDTPSGGCHLFFKFPKGLRIPNNANKIGEGLDLRSNGYICSGDGYKWRDDKGHGLNASITDAPAWLLDLIRNLGRPGAAVPAAPSAPISNNGNAGGYWLGYYLYRAREGNRNNIGFDLALQLRDSWVPEDEAESLMRRYAQMVPGDGYSEREALASLKQAYLGTRRESARLPGITAPPPQPDNRDYREPPGLNDVGNGQRLAQLFGGRLCYVTEWGWLAWDGKRWQADLDGAVMRFAKATARSIFSEAARATTDEQAKALGKWAGGSHNRNRIESMIAMARSEPTIAARPGEFDGDPMLLNVQNGILDLQTGELNPHDPGAKLTKLAGALYDPGAQAPTWLAFLDRVFNGNRELIAFVQRAVGYSLTGDVGEQCLFFLYGTGANGKSTFTGAVQDMMGDYAMKTRAETLMLKKQDSIPEEVAQLAGVRFMLAAELGEGQRLNESLIKDLTGGDRLRARLLYSKSFEFLPVSKPWLYGNHKPTIRGTDEGIWRRPRLIPFRVTIPESDRDPKMPEKLRAELPGILAWAVRGCLEWQRVGLQTPAIVKAATHEFRVEQDILAGFLNECCIFKDEAIVTAGELYKTYKRWAEENGLNPMSNVNLSRQMGERGYSTRDPDGKPRRTAAGRALYKGIGLQEPERVEEPQSG
ncbi:MAG TPA: phage/plasmid primase, P4 family [Anaerolineales bacterium]|nr:phage/plasmid primase, P4 family [Anaerolineales bacterium]